MLKQPGANTIAVVDAVQALLPNLRGVPPDAHVAVGFDQSKYIRAAVTSLQHEALQGGLFAILIILLFLVSFRATGIVAVAIPLSIISTFVLLYFTGQSLNVFTLGGLALGVGRLVDDSIVELENIHRHLGLGQSRRAAVLAAAQEVAMPILVSTITTIVVFFPVLFLQGVARNLFIPLALTITLRAHHELLRLAHGDAAVVHVLAQGAPGRRLGRPARPHHPRAGPARSRLRARAGVGAAAPGAHGRGHPRLQRGGHLARSAASAPSSSPRPTRRRCR